MAGEVDGVEAQEQTERGQQGEPQGQGRPQEEQPTREPVSDGDRQAQLAAKDEQVEALRAKVAQAAKIAEAIEALNTEIAELKRQMADERTEFALKSAGARNVKAARPGWSPPAWGAVETSATRGAGSASRGSPTRGKE